jgi:hypothetical protein
MNIRVSLRKLLLTTFGIGIASSINVASQASECRQCTIDYYPGGNIVRSCPTNWWGYGGKYCIWSGRDSCRTYGICS